MVDGLLRSEQQREPVGAAGERSWAGACWELVAEGTWWG